MTLYLVGIPVLAAAAAFAQPILQAIDGDAPAAEALLEKLVNINSGTFHPAGVARVAEALRGEFETLGFTVRLIDNAALKRGPHLVAERSGTRGKRILLIGHMDTVFEPDSPFQRWQRSGTRATGPGTADMKGGIVVMLSALKALHRTGELEGARVTVFLTGDEESAGRPLEASRGAFIQAGKNAQATLCFESGIREAGTDYASIARRGATSWDLRVKGRAGHSGRVFSPALGHGAIFELSRILNAFHETLREPDMTFSVGLVLGGGNTKVDSGGHASVEGKSNIVPPEAFARGDLRVLTASQLGRVKDKMQSIVARSLPGTSAEISFGDSYPPMATTAGNQRLLDLLNDGNRAMGTPVMPALDPMLRGAGDVSFVAPYVDSITGLGGMGGGSHAEGEFVDLSSLPLQAKRAALLILKLSRD
ncbi:MAG: M20 family metallopeptidase [Acidobacteria bacterium]|nr:M20 family metallopeptidase [Acidobacteriota bacterium]